MSHNIHFDANANEFAFYSVKERAWWDGGQISEVYEDSTAVLKKAHLDFPVIKAPDTYHFPSGKTDVSEISFHTYRADTEVILGTGIGSAYKVVQNAEAFAFFDEIAKGEGIKYETAGALGKGQRIFITAKLPDYIRVGKDDIIEKYLFLTMSHDGKESIMAAFTPIRIVCNNTLNAALANCSNVVKIRHTEDVKEQLKEAHKIMGMVNTLTPLMEQAFNHWAQVKITDKAVQRLIQIALAPNRETLDFIRDGRLEELSGNYRNQVFGAYGYAMMSESQKLETTKGTLFGAYNAITGYFQNVKNYGDNEEKLNSIIYGGIAQKKAQATFQLCEDFARQGEDALLLN